MAPALVLTAERAAELGYVGTGPFALGGAFPGEYLVDQPLEVRFLGFDSEEAARAAFDEAFPVETVDVPPLEWVDVEVGEGLPVRSNHALSEAELFEEAAGEVVEEAAAIRTHAEADRIAEELGVTFPDGAKLEEKKDAIAAFRAGSDPAAGVVAGDPQEITPALGAEGTTPTPVADDEETSA